jgi:transcription termination factor Rho
MSILDRSVLEASPLADLHAIASELSIDGYRRLRRPELIDAILARQRGEGGAADNGADAVDEGIAETDEVAEAAGDEPQAGDEDRPARRRRGRRAGRGRGADAQEESVEEPEEEAVEEPEEEPAEEPEQEPLAEKEEEIATGVVELLSGGAGFLRVHPPDPSEDDVYISAAQVKRCELVSGDEISGPRREPRRSERFASMIRIDTINGRPAAEFADGIRYDDLPAAFPSEPLRLGSDDATIQAIESLAPIGRGSRVTITGPARAGKTEALRRLAAALAPQEALHLSLVLAGVRPEEIAEWRGGPVEPVASAPLGTPAEVQSQTIELTVEQARRLAARGADAVLLIDSLEGLPAHTARKALASARNVVDGGSLTVIATALAPVGGETTVIALDPLLAMTRRFPALDLVASWTIRPELLVGEAGAESIARARAEALDA